MTLHFYKEGCCIVKLMEPGNSYQNSRYAEVEIYGPFRSEEAAKKWTELPENKLEEGDSRKYRICFLANPDDN